MDLLVQQLVGRQGPFFDTILPLRPQRFGGFGSFILFSGTTRHSGTGGFVAVVLNVTRVGGRYSATMLPTELSYKALQDFLTPLTGASEDPLVIVVGCRSRPWRTQVVTLLMLGAHCHEGPGR